MGLRRIFGKSPPGSHRAGYDRDVKRCRKEEKQTTERKEREDQKGRHIRTQQRHQAWKKEEDEKSSGSKKSVLGRHQLGPASSASSSKEAVGGAHLAKGTAKITQKGIS